jgi:hypothetical protein
MEQPIENEEIIENVTMSAGKANLYGSLIYLPVILIFGIPFISLWGLGAFKLGGIQFITKSMSFFTTLLIGIVLHEGIHGLFWAIYCKNGIKSIKFGVKWEYLTPYAHCKENLTVNQYKLGAAMPGILLGILPTIIAIIIGNTWLLYAGILFTGAAGGDILILWKLRKYDSNYLMKDHPDEIGFMVLKNNSKPQF